MNVLYFFVDGLRGARGLAGDFFFAGFASVSSGAAGASVDTASSDFSHAGTSSTGTGAATGSGVDSTGEGAAGSRES